MKKNLYSLALNKSKIAFGFFFLFPLVSLAQHTFSICAVDPVTGQVGSAGATCISSSANSAIIISDVHPGVGVVHTQAAWLGVNQINARNYMNLGYTPQQIVDSVTANDFTNNPSSRQYGVVDLDGGGRSAGYTGINCYNYKNHILGPTYAIQGNILAGQEILDSMEARFLNTPGTLACRLMAALQGAKVLGADIRCNLFGISSFSSFIRVANTNDTAGNLFLDITVNVYPLHYDPVDSLQTLFDLWGGCNATSISSVDTKTTVKLFPNPVSDFLTLESTKEIKNIDLINIENQTLRKIPGRQSKSLKIDSGNLDAGIYFLRIRTADDGFITMKFVKTN